MMHDSTAGLFLHASSVVTPKGAVLFLGHSTSGKSTIAKMLAPVFPILSDDAVFACPDSAGTWRVCNGDFRRTCKNGLDAAQSEGQRLLREKESVPLWKCFRLQKADTLWCAPMQPIELACQLMNAVGEIEIQGKFGIATSKRNPMHVPWNVTVQRRKCWFQQTAAISRVIQSGFLHFALDTPVEDLSRLLSEAAPSD